MNLDKLKGHIPDSVIKQIPDIQTKFEINTPLRLAHFLAQAGHESGGFTAVNISRMMQQLQLMKESLKKLLT